VFLDKHLIAKREEKREPGGQSRIGAKKKKKRGGRRVSNDTIWCSGPPGAEKECARAQPFGLQQNGGKKKRDLMGKPRYLQIFP